ncbi:hypothetical protein EVAR_88447_1 [Eumeta japonica]|uniref:Uncharacterized protein n=1 Tax=Eumeta variegata TaxID=151549 RepID=A0A4C1SL74_EUMVA|nr:hypothetical protein EVAR_88447_1 [Eumeta japonica]
MWRRVAMRKRLCDSSHSVRWAGDSRWPAGRPKVGLRRAGAACEAAAGNEVAIAERGKTSPKYSLSARSKNATHDGANTLDALDRIEVFIKYLLGGAGQQPLQMNRLSFGRGPLFASLCCATAAQHLYESKGTRPARTPRSRYLVRFDITTAFASYFLSKRQVLLFYTATKETTRRLVGRGGMARAAGGGAVYKQRLVNANGPIPKVNGETGESCALCTDAARNMSVHSKGENRLGTSPSRPLRGASRLSDVRVDRILPVT